MSQVATGDGESRIKASLLEDAYDNTSTSSDGDDTTSSQEEEEEEAIVRENAGQSRKTKKRSRGRPLHVAARQKKRLHLPSYFKETEFNSSGGGGSDDPSHVKENNDRVRGFPHKEGNWPSHIYIVPSATEKYRNGIRCAEALMRKNVEQRIVHAIDPDDMHVSLTRPFVLRRHHIDRFVESVRKALSDVEGFTFQFDGVMVLVNDENTRSFGSMTVGKGKEEFVKIIRTLDSVLAEYRQPTYYEEAIPHMSTVWCLGKTKGARKWSSIDETEEFYADHVDMKIGNRCFCIPLSTRKVQRPAVV